MDAQSAQSPQSPQAAGTSRLPRGQRPWQRRARVPGWAVGTISRSLLKSPSWSLCSLGLLHPWSSCCVPNCAPRPCAPSGAQEGAASARGAPTTRTRGLCLSRSTTGRRCGIGEGGEVGDGGEWREGDRGEGVERRGGVDKGGWGTGEGGPYWVRPGGTAPGSACGLGADICRQQGSSIFCRILGFRPLQD